MTQALAIKPISSDLLLRGLVQGQGIRPTIVRIATMHGITGTVCNSFRGVEIMAMGDPGSVRAFQAALVVAFDQASLLELSAKTFVEREHTDFCIVDSVPGQDVQTTIPLDLAVCPDCLCDVRSPSNRRFAYPFTTCTRCGPRYSILRRMPFDRKSTSMAAFSRCRQCEAEYRDPNNRRFHAQTIACAECGPRCWATNAAGKKMAMQSQAIEFVAQQILSGKIAAVKGVGGYQLICDATNNDAVQLLRERKQRRRKPLPVMVNDIFAAYAIAEQNQIERTRLQDPSNPIVLLQSLDGNGLSCAVSPNLKTIGVMLATSPLHAILLDLIGKPLVVTSGNVHGSPLVYQNKIAESQLAEIADVFLHHDREIANPIDDSVVQCFGRHFSTLRAARGLAPLTFPSIPAIPAIAVGGHQKVALAMSTGNAFVLAPHIGDMKSESSRVRFQDSVGRLQSLYQTHSQLFVSDQHPDYFTSSWVRDRGPDHVEVQHHHAHIVAAMLDHQVLDETVLGLAFDGTGFSHDGTIWGGEAMLATRSDYERVGHLRRFRLPSGENAIKDPRRISESLFSHLDGWAIEDSVLRYSIEHGPVTSSMGRLFDGFAAMVLDIETVDYEGEAAIRLEAHCDLSESSAYEFVIAEGSPIQFDWRPVITGMRSDLHCLSTQRIAMKFHRSVAKLVIDLAQRYAKYPCVVTGGVFQNRVLLELICEMASKRSVNIRLPGKIPVNDGGLALGQLVVASAQQDDLVGDVSCV